ncbi:hypothetical protein ONZ43_g4320 [Nemania bipapillata]|uniref:Uncharacterized protein n=1 Tax=Nemania bipapillata TaxID=110536 RepID=A0ACC2IPE6_9PEZI|nr:hypothetical protein ONZ43_g4320 [Nemania bipapillata]
MAAPGSSDGANDISQSAEPASGLANEGGREVDLAMSEGSDPTTAEDKMAEDIRARDELDKEHADLKAQIKQLTIKLQEVEKQRHSLPSEKGREEIQDEGEEVELMRRMGELEEQKSTTSSGRNSRCSIRELMLDRPSEQSELREFKSIQVTKDGLLNPSPPLMSPIKLPVKLEGPRDKDLEINLIPKLNRIGWSDFWSIAHPTDKVDRFAIDVLVGPVQVAIDDLGFRRQRKLKTTATTTDDATNHRKPTGKTLVQGQAQLPERIRINSQAITKVLTKIHGGELPTVLNREISPGPFVMMQPFRTLTLYRHEIKEWKIRLEAKFGKVTEKASESGNDESTAQDNGDNDDMLDAGEVSKSESKNQGQPVSIYEEDDEIDNDSDLNQRSALDELNCLIEFIGELEDRLAYLVSSECQRVTFNDIWHVFKPGDLVLSKDEKQAYRVINVFFPEHKMVAPSMRDIWMFDAKAKLKNSPIIIQCVYIDFDGEQIGPCLQTFSIYRFEGEKNIRSLDVIPFRLAKKADLEKTLIERGSRFIEVCDNQRRGVPMHYSGLTLETQEEVDSQVVIDFEEAFAAQDGGGNTVKPSVWTKEKIIVDFIYREMDEEDKQTSSVKWKPTLKRIGLPDEGEEDANSDFQPPSSGDRSECIRECCSDEIVLDDTYVEQNHFKEFLHGQLQRQGMSSERVSSLATTPRSLGEATEAKLDLTYLGPTKGESTFDLLVLPPGHREMVESLVTQHFLDKESSSDETSEVDIVRGKECVATYFNKPLFQITCGDLGSTADIVESRLETNFALASRWGCILLIDEADVFLEARQTENFDRNSLVAVFLRALEYYTGILFLTTNRVGTFDEAFTSRVHISLYYPPLSQASTLEVFKVNLTRMKERFQKKKERGEAELELNERSIDEFILRYWRQHKDARWNGRQIRNACQTALALAEFEAHKVANPGVSGGRRVMEVAAKANKMINVQLSAKHFINVAKAYLAFMRTTAYAKTSTA